VKPTFYVTTPIYYVNAAPHLGTAYTTIAADVIARYKRLDGYDVHLLTGTDEHGQKIVDASGNAGMEPQAWVDAQVEVFRDTWKLLGISADDFIRTTEPRHEANAARFMQDLFDKGFIYKGHYEGWYCVHEETFYTEEQLEEGHACPECARPCQPMTESNYFFKLSEFGQALLDHYDAHPSFIEPDIRRNEVVSFVRSGLKDLSISRPKTSLTWGIQLPFDPDHVMYVWVDALLNYITAIGYGTDEAEFARWWPADRHLVGKDIIRFHCVIWPAMLMAVGLPLPKQIFAHGFLLAKGEKMSKSKGNVLSPAEIVERFGADAYRYYFMREVAFGADGNVSMETMVLRYNADLANDYGNLVSRVTNMFEKYLDGRVPALPEAADAPAGPAAEADRDLVGGLNGLAEAVAASLECLQYSDALREIWDRVKLINRYVEDSAPWNLAKTEDPAARRRLEAVLYNAAEAVRICTVFIWPVMPAAAEAAWHQLGLADALGPLDGWTRSEASAPDAADGLARAAHWGRLPEGARVHKGDALFPRIYEES
jgi:methionyl-tRNA synthetase